MSDQPRNPIGEHRSVARDSGDVIPSRNYVINTENKVAFALLEIRSVERRICPIAESEITELFIC